MTADDRAPATRIGHRERELAVQALADHYASGRLTGDEYSERVGAAWESRTAPDLHALFSDLPGPRPDAAVGPTAVARPWPPPAPVPGPVFVGSVDPAAPWGREPGTGLPYSDKSKILAGLLQLFLPFGVGRFYSGHIGMGVAQLLLSPIGIGVFWAFVDGIVLLAGHPTDRYGRPMRT